jgi:hypothetical protein
MHKEGDNRPQQIHQPEAKPQGSSERQPLPDALDVLARRVQFQEDHRAGRIIGQLKLREARQQQANELKTVYEHGTDRDRLILNVYTTLSKSRSDESILFEAPYLRPQKTRDLIARVAPMTEVELREELRKAQEALERKTAALRKRDQTWILYQNLTPEERDEKRREAHREYARGYRQRRREQARSQTEQQQPTQIYPHPTE